MAWTVFGHRNLPAARNARLSESYKCPHSDFSSRDLIWIKLWEQFEAGSSPYQALYATRAGFG
jgi:hypothetical protein